MKLNRNDCKEAQYSNTRQILTIYAYYTNNSIFVQ